MCLLSESNCKLGEACGDADVMRAAAGILLVSGTRAKAEKVKEAVRVGGMQHFFLKVATMVLGLTAIQQGPRTLGYSHSPELLRDSEAASQAALNEAMRVSMEVDTWQGDFCSPPGFAAGTASQANGTPSEWTLDAGASDHFA